MQNSPGQCHKSRPDVDICLRKKKTLTAKRCEEGMHHIINTCGGFSDGDHGGTSEDDVWNFQYVLRYSIFEAFVDVL